MEKSGDENAAKSEKPLDIPKELWMMVDHLFRNAIKQVRRCVAEASMLVVKKHCTPF